MKLSVEWHVVRVLNVAEMGFECFLVHSHSANIAKLYKPSGDDIHI